MAGVTSNQSRISEESAAMTGLLALNGLTNYPRTALTARNLLELRLEGT